jgi:hydrogenase expression/formation protein
MDVEEFVRRRMGEGAGHDAILKSLSDHLLKIKPISKTYADAFANAVIEEVENTRGLTGDFFYFEQAGVTMGDFGVGSRGTGDFFAHRQIARIIGKTAASVGVDEMDDAGAVLLKREEVTPRPWDSTERKTEVPDLLEISGKSRNEYIICTVDGMHSRLSDFPFLAGFHVTRATLRDVYVMGAHPVMLFSDIHVADDGDGQGFRLHCRDYCSG